MPDTTDVLILGSGCGGSLLSMILARQGVSVTVVDRARHPRFAIGESSTPLADATLAALAGKYDLPELRPLAKYGSWKTHYPNITCGLKRGFSYFGHRPHAPLAADDQLLVAASSRDERSDTHWLRSDVDAFLFRSAAARGVRQFESADFQLSLRNDLWTVSGTAEHRNAFSITSPFAVDATGAAGQVLQVLQVPDQTHRLITHSQAVFAHFSGVLPVATGLDNAGISRRRHPFCCDAAAVHHVLDDGWMWQLRFDDDTVSSGFVTDSRTQRQPTHPVQYWQHQLQRFPFLREQYAEAEIIRPADGLRTTGRLQRLTTQAAGSNWAALPGTAGFIDPLHSTGIAHTLFGVRRLADVILHESAPEHRSDRLAAYSGRVIDELFLIDELVEGCYAALPDFRLWCAWCMLYFAAVTSMEQSGPDGDPSFLRADDAAFRSMVSRARKQLSTTIACGRSSSASTGFEQWLRDAIKPWNHVGLLDPQCRGMYSRTAAPE